MAIQDTTNHTKIRAIRVNDELWNLFRQCAEANGETASEAIRNLMQDYIDETTLYRGETAPVPGAGWDGGCLYSGGLSAVSGQVS